MSAHWEYLTHEDVRAIHSYLIATFGGLDGLRDEGLFDAAIEQPRQTFDGVDLYPSAAKKLPVMLMASLTTILLPTATNARVVPV